jgi:actin-related protein 8
LYKIIHTAKNCEVKIHFNVFQQIQAKTIIIIHPGSQNLRIGLASAINPHTMLHAIARRLKPGGELYVDSYLPPEVPKVSV